MTRPIRPRLVRLARIALVTTLLSYVGVCIAFHVFQRRLIYPAPSTLREPRCAPIVEGTGDLRIAWRPSDRVTVVYFHGNGEQLGSLDALCDFFAEHDIGFVAIEYPGYPGASGSPSEGAILDAAQRGLALLTRERGLAPSGLVLSGYSLGAGVAVQLAARGWGTKLLLLAPFTSLGDAAHAALPLVPVHGLLDDDYDSLAVAAHVRQPTLVIHGTSDALIPFLQGAALASHIGDARLVAVPGAGHGDLWAFEATRSAALAFVR